MFYSNVGRLIFTYEINSRISTTIEAVQGFQSKVIRKTGYLNPEPYIILFVYKKIGTNMITNLSITDMYMSVLSSLSIDDKLDLIAKLTNSIRHKNEARETTEDLFANFSGDWSEISAESLRESRTFTRTVDTW